MLERLAAAFTSSSNKLVMNGTRRILRGERTMTLQTTSWLEASQILFVEIRVAKPSLSDGAAKTAAREDGVEELEYDGLGLA
jgi:hypothetical protein